MLDIESFKQKLTEELVLVTEELKSLGIHNPSVPEDWIAVAEHINTSEADENVHADSSEDLATRSALVADLETRYNNINRALQKIESDKYGICEINGEQIEEKRLEANPAARTCIAHINEESTLT